MAVSLEASKSRSNIANHRGFPRRLLDAASYFLSVADGPRVAVLGLMESANAAGESRPPKLLDRVRSAVRLRHYSPRTEEAYAGWIRRFVIFHHKRHPSEMGIRKYGSF